jgi:hypothetical protein
MRLSVPIFAAVLAASWLPWAAAEPAAETPPAAYDVCDDTLHDALGRPVSPADHPASDSPYAACDQAIDWWQRRLLGVRARALLEPTPENVAAYLAAYRDALVKADAFMSLCNGQLKREGAHHAAR